MTYLIYIIQKDKIIGFLFVFIKFSDFFFDLNLVKKQSITNRLVIE